MDERKVYPLLHPRSALRLAAALGGTLWTIGRLGRCGSPRLSAHRWAGHILRRMGVEARLLAPVPEGAQVWVSNHLSWLDPLIFLSLRPSSALAKAEVAAYPLVGTGAQRIGLRFVNRSSLFSRAAALRGMIRDLHAGQDFLLFPEGTTTTGERLAPLHEGGLRMAYRLGVKLLPFRLATEDAHYPWIGDDSLMPHLKRVICSRGTRVTVLPGPVMDPAAWPTEDLWVQAIRRHLSPPAAAA